jgi:hypothetical protein
MTRSGFLTNWEARVATACSRQYAFSMLRRRPADVAADLAKYAASDASSASTAAPPLLTASRSIATADTGFCVASALAARYSDRVQRSCSRAPFRMSTASWAAAMALRSFFSSACLPSAVMMNRWSSNHASTRFASFSALFTSRALQSGWSSAVACVSSVATCCCTAASNHFR